MDLRTKRWNLFWATQKSVRYHTRRQGFYDTWRKATAFVSVLFASAAGVDIMSVSPTDKGHLSFALVASFVVAGMAAFDLVVGTSEMARTHDSLRRRFIALEAAIKPLAETTEAELEAWCKERLAIEMDEPPTYVAVDLLCENELHISKGKGPRFIVPFMRRMTANWWRHEDLRPDPVEQKAPAAS